MKNSKNLWMLPAGLVLIALAFLSYLYGHRILRAVGLAEHRLELADDYNPETLIAGLPAGLSPGCRHWYEVALRSSFDTPRGYLLQTLPRVAVSPTAEATELSDGRDFTGLCEADEADRPEPALLNTNLNRALIGFSEDDTGRVALAVREMKVACLRELDDGEFGPLVYRVWRVMTGARSADPCD